MVEWVELAELYESSVPDFMNSRRWITKYFTSIVAFILDCSQFCSIWGNPILMFSTLFLYYRYKGVNVSSELYDNDRVAIKWPLNNCDRHK